MTAEPTHLTLSIPIQLPMAMKDFVKQVSAYEVLVAKELGDRATNFRVKGESTTEENIVYFQFDLQLNR